MSGKLPVCTSKEVVRVLEKAGWSVVRQRGSHAYLRREHGGLVVVPMHSKDLPTGTLRRILRDAHMNIEEFKAFL